MSTQPQAPRKTYAVIPVAVDAFLVAIATLAIVLRFISRKLSKAGFWWDDWFALAAWPFSVGISLSFLVDAFHGFGQRGGDPTFFLHTLYFDEIWYNTGIALTKISVLCFYHRIFAVDVALRRALWITGGFVIAWWITFELASILQCIPIAAYWNPKIKAVCVEKFPFFIGQAVPNIVLDLVLLILPLRPLWKLHLRRPQKYALLAVFVLGYLNPVISILRIVSFFQLGTNTGANINYVFVSPALWSATEVAIAVFSCSIPSLSYLFRKVVDSRPFASGKGSSRAKAGSASSGHSDGSSTMKKGRGKSMLGHEFDPLESDPGNGNFSLVSTSAMEDNKGLQRTGGNDSHSAFDTIHVQRHVEVNVAEAV